MKRKIFILFAILTACTIAVSAFDGFPTRIWDTIGNNTERQASNLKADNIDARSINPIWIYPRIDAGSIWIKTLDDTADVTVTDGMFEWNEAGDGSHPVGIEGTQNLSDMRSSKFLWVEATSDLGIVDDEISKVKYEFKNLDKGDYQTNLSVPSNLTINDNDDYAICNQARVIIQVNDEFPLSFNVNLNKDSYSGKWIYAGNEVWHVGTDNSTISVTITNIGRHILNNGDNSEDSDAISQIPIVLADAVRLVKMSDAKTVGSPVSGRMLDGTIIKDDFQVSYDSQEWEPVIINSMFNYSYLADLEIGEIAYNNRVLYALNGGTATYELTPLYSGAYEIKINLPKMANIPNQVISQDFKLLDDTGTPVGEFSVPVGGGWQLFGPNTFDLEAGKTYLLQSVTQGADAGCVLDAVKMTLISASQFGFPMLFTSLSNYVGDKPNFTNILYTGKFVGINASGDDGSNVAKDVWSYPNESVDLWEPLEGPVAKGFATSPLLLQMKDHDGERDLMAAFVGDENGVFYAFDASGSNMGSIGQSRLLFKGPGIFKSEPLNAPNGWTQTGFTETAFGAKYLYSGHSSADQIIFEISDTDRFAAGDGDIIDSFGTVVDSHFKYKLKIWIPSDAGTSIGAQMRIGVDYGISNLLHKDYTVTIGGSDLGTWKNIDAVYSFSRVSRVTIEPVYGVAVVDNIWLAPALPPGEDYDFGDVVPVADILIAPDGSTLSDLQRASKVFATTAAGRVWAFDITALFNINSNRIGKLAYAYPTLTNRVYFNNELDLVTIQPTWNNGWLYIAGKTDTYPGVKTWDFRRFDDNRSFNPNFSDLNNVNYEIIKSYTNTGLGTEVDPDDFLSGGISQIRDKINPNLNYFWLSNSKNNMDQFTLDLFTNIIAETGSIEDNLAAAVDMTTYSKSIPSILSMSIPDPVNPQNDENVVIPDFKTNIYSFGAVSRMIADAYPKEADMDMYSSVVGNIMRVSNIDEDGDGFWDLVADPKPQGFVGLSNGYMRAFNLRTSENLKLLLAGVPGDPARRIVKSVAQIINGADIAGNSLVNINGADGYSWAYSDKVYGGNFQGEKPFADDWIDYTDEGIEEIDPGDLTDTRADIQFDILDYQTATDMLKLFDASYTGFSQASLDLLKFNSTDPALNKAAIDSWISDNNIKYNMLSKSMRVIPKETWNYIMTGSPTEVSTDTVISGNERVFRYRLYMLKEALKARSSLDVEGNEIATYGAGRSLFWNSGKRNANPASGFPRVRLEYGDKIYVALWNMESALSIPNGSFLFMYGNNENKNVPANLVRTWEVPYTVLRETDDGYEPILGPDGNALTKKILLAELKLFGAFRPAVGMTGGFYVQVGTRDSLPYRIPVPSLRSTSELLSFDPYLKEAGDWIIARRRGNRADRRETFGFNNPLGIRIGNKEIGLSYDRFDTSENNNYKNGLPSGNITDNLIKLDDYNHGSITPLKDIVEIANRSMMEINGIRYNPANHNGDINDLYSKPFPWEYGSGSLDYPSISKDSVSVINGNNDNMVKSASSLDTKKPWDPDATDPYTDNRSGDVADADLFKVKYQVDIPVYQPAMKKYVANAVIYIDITPNGKFDKTGDINVPNINDEPYRAFQIEFGVKPEASIVVESDYVDFGNAGHGIGYPLALNGIFFPFYNNILGIQQGINNNFNVRKPEISRWFKPFRVINEGNVNLFNLSVNKQPLFANTMDPDISMFDEIEESLAYDNNWKNALRIHENSIVSSLDYVSQSILKGDLNSSNGMALNYPFSTNPKSLYNDLANGATYTLSKARVGDTEESILTIPDMRKIKGREFRFNGSGSEDYNRSGSSGYIMDVRDVEEPKIAVQIPIGQPMGSYSTKYPIKVRGEYYGETADNSNSILRSTTSADGIFLNVDVKEAQITGMPYDRKTSLASLYHIGEEYIGSPRNYYSFDNFNDATPMAFQKSDGKIGMTWTSNSFAMSNIIGDQTDDVISLAPSNISIGMLKNERDVESDVISSIGDTHRFYDRINWWRSGNVVMGDQGWPNNLLVDMSGEGLEVPFWSGSSGIKQSRQYNPSYYSYDGVDSYLTFSGRAEIADSNGNLIPSLFESRIFYIDAADFVNGANSASGAVNSLTHLDAITEKKYPVMTSFDGDKKWFFWQSSESGKSSISFTTEDVSTTSGVNTLDGYSLENKVRLPNAIASAGKPNVMPFVDDDGNRKLDLVYTGINTITGRTDVYLTRYNGTLNDSGIFGLTENAVPLPRVYEEMLKDTKFDFYLSSGLAWMRQNQSGDIPTEDLPAVVIGLNWDNSNNKYDRYIDIFTGANTNFVEADWANGAVDNLPVFKNLMPNAGSSYPRFSFDTATNVMTIEYEPNSIATNELGKTLIDFSSGVIRFTRLKEREEFASSQEQGTSVIYNKPACVYASYVPQTLNLTLGDGINDGGYAFCSEYYDKYSNEYCDIMTVMWRKTAANTSDGIYYKVFEISSDPNVSGRTGFTTKIDERKVPTDGNGAGVNENSISGFFDNRIEQYGKLWIFWTGTKSGTSSIYYATDALKLVEL